MYLMVQGWRSEYLCKPILTTMGFQGSNLGYQVCEQGLYPLSCPDSKLIRIMTVAVADANLTLEG